MHIQIYKHNKDTINYIKRDTNMALRIHNYMYELLVVKRKLRHCLLQQ